MGSYEISGSLGAGGMGEVYRARDVRLNRDVALKLLPDVLAADPERLARFEREAQVLASLNHPHIAAIYGIEDSSGRPALVLELVEGPTLSDRIEQGPLPVEDAIAVAGQMADALEAAHERGIVHRDIKPSNVKLTSDGSVKVLDFGLARLVEPPGKTADADRLSISPTITSPAIATGVGVILGTAAYMSPEQARGGPADHRSDIFSLGVVLYEMLTGRRPFQGEAAADVLASILVRDADLTSLPSSLSPRLVELLRRCLDKSPRRRWQAVGDVRAELEMIAASPQGATVSPLDAAPRSSLSRRALIVGLTAPVSAAIGGGVAWMLRAPPSPVPVRLGFSLPDGQRFGGGTRRVLAIAPDASQIAYVADRLYIRTMNDYGSRALQGTERGLIPAFSPDGRMLAYFAPPPERVIKRVATSDSGSPEIVCPAINVFGISWHERDIIFTTVGRVLRVSQNGGEPETLVEMAAGEYVTQAQMLPGGEALLLSIVKEGETGNIDANEIAVYSLTSRTRTKLSVTGADARWLATGHLVYAFQGRLYGASFDPKRLTLGSDPVPVVDGVALSVSGGVGNVAAWADYSANGWLAYVPGSSTAALAVDLVRIDRATGVTQALKLPPFASSFPRISPDGQRIAFQVDSGRDSQVWIYWLDRRAEPTQLTYEGRNRFPIWSWDSRRVVFQSDRDNDLGLFWQRADGGDAPKRLTTADKGTAHMPESWRPKSDEFSYSVTSDAGATIHLHSTGTGRSTRFGDIRSERPLSPLNSAFSPDGDWLAYTIRGAGGVSVWVHPFPFTGASMRKIPDDGAHHPLFAANPLELFYLGAVAGASRVASVKVNAGFELTGIRESTVFSPTTPTLPRNYDVSVDGRFFIAVALRDDQRASEIRIVQHWSEELRAKVRRG